MSIKTMHAIQVAEYGGAGVLKLVEAPVPQPGQGQVLIRLHASGVNPVDWKVRAGYFQKFMPVTFPWTPGAEGAGLVEALGPGGSGFQAGQAVYGPFGSSYAQYALASASDLQLKPARLSFEEAASIPVGALTAWAAVAEAALQPGQSVLVHGAAGGVGLFAVQLARWKGAKVYGTASSSNLEYVRSLGAEAIDYSAGPFEQKARNLDAVIDTVGGDLPERSVKVLRRGGVLVGVAGRLAEGLGGAEGVRALGVGRAPADKLADITRLIEEGRLAPAVYKVFPLAEAGQAHDLSQTGHGRGRIVLRID